MKAPLNVSLQHIHSSKHVICGTPIFYLSNKVEISTTFLFTPLCIFSTTSEHHTSKSIFITLIILSFYRYCNVYAFADQISYIFMLDYGFLGELATRWTLIFSNNLQEYMTDVEALFAAEYMNWYLFGFRNGMLFKLLFDIKLAV